MTFIEQLKDWPTNEESPPFANPFVFGEKCILLAAGRESLETGGWDQLQVVLQELRNKNRLRHIYGKASSKTKSTRDQGKNVFDAWCKIVEAVCTPESCNYGLMAEAAVHLDDAWRRDHRDYDEGLFQAYLETRQTPDQHPGDGFWGVCDFADRMLGREDPHTRTATMPILLYSESDDGGLVAELTVELVPGMGGFCPEPFFMGLTAFSMNEPGDDSTTETGVDATNGAHDDSTSEPHDEGQQEGFFDSMQRAWDLSGAEDCGYRGRWKITAYAPKDEEKPPLELPYLTGRSAEAAAYCALCAALGGLPGERYEMDGPLELDPTASITATVKENGGELILGKVRHVPEKIAAAIAKELDLVLLAEVQPEAKENKNSIVVSVAKLADAFEQLLSARKIIANYQNHVRDDWLDDWEEGTADLDPEGKENTERDDKEQPGED